MSPWQGEVGQAAFYRQIAQMDQCYTDDIEPLLTELDCPVNMLWGEQDEWIPLDVGQRLAHRLGGVPLQIRQKRRSPCSGRLSRSHRSIHVFLAVTAGGKAILTIRRQS
nr:hypothetical protein PJ912_09280 [Pectobacterium colocasium]